MCRLITLRVNLIKNIYISSGGETVTNYSNAFYNTLVFIYLFVFYIIFKKKVYITMMPWWFLCISI